MNCSSTTVKRSSRESPSRTLTVSGATRAGLLFQHTIALTGGDRFGSVNTSPSADMLIVRTGPGRRSTRRIDDGAEVATIVFTVKYEQPPPAWRHDPASA